MSKELEFEHADGLSTGAVGRPGQRAFYIQARQDGTQLTVLLEKEQVAMLAREATEFLDRLSDEFPEEPGDCITECGAEVTDFDNGWRCAAGHSHFSGVEYYDDDEIAGLARRGLPLAPNAARMDGTRI